jgi:hypothetical protein
MTASVIIRVWEPGQYNRKGKWVSGGWIEVEKDPGYWIEERVWISKKSPAKVL